MPFDSPDLPLSDLLKSSAEGKIQLPDFQREWKWDDERIASLLASISVGHPVGVLMMLQRGGEADGFATRPLAGVENPGEADRLLLDGQQRLTSLFQALRSGKPVDTADARGKRLKRWYYVDMRGVLADADREDAIVSVPDDRMLRDNFGRDIVADYSTMDLECRAEMFPLSRVFDHAATNDWMVTYLQLDHEGMAERLERWNEFQQVVLKNFTEYLVPVIVLTKETPREAVCTVFEKVNTGGVPLNVFELLTATFATDGFRLAEDWASRKSRLVHKPVLREVENTDFLQVVTLLATLNRKLQYDGPAEDTPGVSCKRRDILRLSLDEYRTWADKAEEGLEWAASFLALEHIFVSRDLPYKTQLIPLAAIRAVTGPAVDNHGNLAKIRQWYWCGVLGELYGSTTETRFARDIEQVVPWLTGGTLPRTVEDAAFRSGRLATLRTRNSAAYKGIYALLMRSGGLDWQKHQPIDLASFFDYRVDIHHIFPKSWCEKNGVEKDRRESIVNKTAISASTNRSIGGRAPSAYMRTLEQSSGLDADDLDAVVATHAIDPGLLRQDDFDDFFEDRRNNLLDLITSAMGKPAIREEGDEADAEAFEPIEDVEFEMEDIEPEEAFVDAVGIASTGEVTTCGPEEVQPTDEHGVSPEESGERSTGMAPDGAIEREFDVAMLTIYQRASAELNYRPTYFVNMLAERGAHATALHLVMDARPSEGFLRLYQEGRLDLSVEAHVTQPRFSGLFEPDVVSFAKSRLLEFGYEV